MLPAGPNTHHGSPRPDERQLRLPAPRLPVTLISASPSARAGLEAGTAPESRARAVPWGQQASRPPQRPPGSGSCVTVASSHVTITSSRNIPRLTRLAKLLLEVRVRRSQPRHPILGGQRCPGPAPGHGDKEKLLQLCLPQRDPTVSRDTPPHPEASTSLPCSYHCKITARQRQSRFYFKKKQRERQTNKKATTEPGQCELGWH